VDEIALMTHFSDADGPKGIAEQLTVFKEVTRDLPGERTLANSAAVLRFGGDAQVRGDWVRPGIAMYGSAPDYPENDIAHWDLEPAMTLASRLIGVQQLKPGDTVGYGSNFAADRDMRIGVVACGYADGYPRHCNTGTPILVGGTRTQLVGRVSMDMLAVDLTPVPEAKIDTEVTLWGRAGNGAVLAIDEVARAAGTLGYELMCALAQRVPVNVDA
jgi:alanine racemase